MAHLGMPTPLRMKAKKGTVACTATNQAAENFSVCSLIAPQGMLASRQWVLTPSSLTGRACSRRSCTDFSLATCSHTPCSQVCPLSRTIPPYGTRHKTHRLPAGDHQGRAHIAPGSVQRYQATN